MGRLRPRKGKLPRPRKSAENLEEIFCIVSETASDAIIAIDERGVIIFANPTTEKIFGYAPRELLGREITTLMPDHLREVYRRSFSGHLETGKKHISWAATPMIGLHRDGSEFPLEISIGESLRKGKRIFTGIARDVSDRHRVLRDLMHSEEKYAKMVQASPDAITLRTFPGRRYIEANEGFARLTGYSAAEVVGKTPAELGLWAGDFPHQEILGDLERDGEVHGREFEFRTKSGEMRFGRVSAARVIVDGKPCMLSITRDITEQMRSMRALEKSEARFRALIQDAPHGIYRVARDGRLLGANPALVNMLGYDSEQELLERNMATDVFVDPRMRERLIADNWYRESYRDLDVEWKRKDGKIIRVRMNGRPVESEADELDYFEVFVEDVTERRNLEKQLLQAQRMEAIGQLAGGIAHDFNNLLGVILGQVEILNGHMAGDETLSRRTEAIKQAAGRAANLTGQLLAFSRKQVMEPVVFDVNTSVHEIEPLLRRLIGEDVELVIRPGRGVGCIRADPSRIEQVFMNLAVNARDAMPGGGKLVIETAAVELDGAYVRQHVGANTGDFVLLTVSDTGSGMDAATMACIFEPFFTTKEPGRGTGLGLSTVYGIVKQSGGYIMPYSELGHGTIFRIYLPRVAEAGQASVRQLSQGKFLWGSETILLVEDEAGLRDLAVELLTAGGYKLLSTGDVAEALEIVRRGDQKIDLLLTDVVMPGMDGHELAAQILAIRPIVKVLYMSGYTDDVIARRGILSEGTLLLPKPFTRKILLEKVRQALGDSLDAPARVPHTSGKTS